QNLRKGIKDVGVEDKIKEVVVANELEQKMSKQEILAAYLNTNYYYGSRIVGIRAAAKYYFNKDVSQLTMPESALLAGIPQAPSYYNPYLPFQDDKATAEQQAANAKVPFERYRMVLSNMYIAGYISKIEYEEAIKLPLAQLLKNGLPASDQTIGAYTAAALSEARQKLNITDDREAIPAGTKIYINVNSTLQKLGNEIQDTNNYVRYPSSEYDMSYSVIENKTGRILAIGAGRNNNTSLTNFNNATQGLRQPGSTIKPILDYAPAIEKFKWSSGKLINDSATNFISSNNRIVNYDNKYKGVMTITAAIADSRNVPAVLAYREVNRDKSHTQNYSADFLKKLGIPLKAEDMYEPYAIGGFTTGVTTLQMASAYSAFGNNGKHATANFVSKITDADNNTVYEWTETADSKQAMSSETASIMTTALNYT
ncbi:MAG: transglycosylase domain-containing protein, partial [Wohlfahrtiimonas sp.]